MTEREKINSLSERDIEIMKVFLKNANSIIKQDGKCEGIICNRCSLYGGFGYFANCSFQYLLNDLDMNKEQAIKNKKDLERFISLREVKE